MKSAKSVPWVRKAQKAFEKAVGEKGELDFSESFIVFGKEALVVDNTKGYENGIRVRIISDASSLTPVNADDVCVV